MPGTAEAWCARLNADDVTEDDRRNFASWLAASPDNRAEYELSALTFALARGLHQAPHLQGAAGPSNSRWRRFIAPALAASAAVLILAGALLTWQAHRMMYATGIGEQQLVDLSDGSLVQLNTASSIGVDLQKAERHVVLRSGEAFFSIARDPTRPFIVQAGASEIHVIGTKFDVRIEGAVTTVMVLEGQVSVREAGHRADQRATEAVELHPGERLRATPTDGFEKLRAVDPTKLVSWREGKIYFDNDPLSVVIGEINRYSETPFVISDPKLGALTLTGVFRTGDTASVLFALEKSYGLKGERDGKRILVKAESVTPGLSEAPPSQ